LHLAPAFNRFFAKRTGSLKMECVFAWRSAACFAFAETCGLSHHAHTLGN
jgi:hypothetical protein